MWLSYVWLALIVCLLTDHPRHPFTAFVVFEIFLIHRLLEIFHCKKKRK
jgi:hypothetical protein